VKQRQEHRASSFLPPHTHGYQPPQTVTVCMNPKMLFFDSRQGCATVPEPSFLPAACRLLAGWWPAGLCRDGIADNRAKVDNFVAVTTHSPVGLFSSSSGELCASALVTLDGIPGSQYADLAAVTASARPVQLGVATICAFLRHPAPAANCGVALGCGYWHRRACKPCWALGMAGCFWHQFFRPPQHLASA
jgi:hypothetical protein